MLFFYLRHGDPIYSPDSLTELGHQQAEALSKRLAVYGLDKVYASTSNRAIQTAQPTCERLGLPIETLDFANEGYAWNDFTIETEAGRQWLFANKESRWLFSEPEVISLGSGWYTHPHFAEFHYEKGIERVCRESDALFASLGYEHIPGTGKYRVLFQNNDRVALFAHQGFGLAFLSCLLDIPYSQFVNHFDMCHTGMTVINFQECDGFCIPKILTLSDDSHLYKEGLPLKYNHTIPF